MRGMMKYKGQCIILFWGFLLLLLSFSGSSKAQACEKTPTLSREEWESYPRREGEYRNCAYRYAITIPEGFIARGEAPTHTEHGVGIWFWVSNHFTGQIWVDGSAASPEGDSPLDEEANKRIEWIRSDAQTILSVKKERFLLDTLPAIRLIVRYVCPDTKIIVDDYFLAIDQGEIEYTLALSAEDAKYEEYKPILEQLAESFRLVGEQKESCQ